MSVRVDFNIAKSLKRYHKKMESKTREKANDLLAEMKAGCPIGKKNGGKLKASLGIKKKGGGFQVGSSIKYASFVELGTSRQSKNPFMRRAWRKLK